METHYEQESQRIHKKSFVLLSSERKQSKKKKAWQSIKGEKENTS